MIRDWTPLPRRPRAEPELLDDMLRLMRFRPPLPSTEIVRIVKAETRASAFDIRMMLCPPYFTLTDHGWVCNWRM